jgi:cytochrome c peroxidase
MSVIRASALLVVALLLSACGPPTRQLDAENPVRPNASSPFGLEEFFAEAPQQPVPTRVRLGRWLFFDKRLSSDGNVACATCHRPEHAFSEPTRVPTGVGGQTGRRKTPSLVNLAARTVLLGEGDPGPTFFWDGRVTSLETQVLMPIADPTEMGLEHPAMLARLGAISGYRPFFSEAFGSDSITLERVAAALADYVRTRVSGNAPYDRWRWAGEVNAVSYAAKKGSDLFSFKAQCATCHAGLNFSDSRFHNLGIGWDPVRQAFDDEGRGAVTQNAGDRGAFKTPALRDVATHAPYMHDGSLPTLRDVVEFYNRGGIKNPWQTGRLRPLDLTADEIDALVAFLESLTGRGYEDRPPRMFPK